MSRPRNDQLRNMLLNQGLAVFIQRGYDGTGLKEVLDPVGVPKGSFYDYFNSKEDFGAEVVRHFAARFLPESMNCLLMNPPMPSRL